jgi:hypothetical protein
MVLLDVKDQHLYSYLRLCVKQRNGKNINKHSDPKPVRGQSAFHRRIINVRFAKVGDQYFEFGTEIFVRAWGVKVAIVFFPIARL